MKTTYYQDDDILVVRLGDAPVVREVSQDWNVHLSFDAAGKVVEIVVLDASKSGVVPVETAEAA